MKKFLSILSFLLIISVAMLSCATTTAFVENVQNYEEYKLDGNSSTRKFFPSGDRNFSYDGKALFMSKLKTVEHHELGAFIDKNEKVISSQGQFTNQNGEKTDVAILINSNDYENFFHKEMLLGRSVKTDTEVAFKIGTGSEIVLRKNDDILISDDSIFPIEVSRIRKILQDGKMKNLASRQTTGFLVKIYGEDFAVTSFFAKPSLFINQKFSHKLSDDEKNFADALVLLLWDYYTTFESDGKGVGNSETLYL